jgi:hypothetical protein
MAENAEWLEMEERDWLIWVTQFWGEIGCSPQSSLDERSGKLAALYAEQRNKPLNEWRVKRHVLRKLTLDVMCASFPEMAPPAALVRLMKHALELPESHVVYGWPALSGMRDDRGDPDHEMRITALLIDRHNLLRHGDYIPLRELARLVKENLGREPDRKSLRRWRSEPDWPRRNPAPPDRGK